MAGSELRDLDPPTSALVTSPPRALQTLADRYDRTAFEPLGGRARVRLAVVGGDAWDAVLEGGMARLSPAEGDADATLTADPEAWTAIADDVRGGMSAYYSGRLMVRRNLHLGVGLLAATSGLREPGRLRFRTVATRRARLSALEAGSGPPIVALHGLGGTKGSFLPTVAALAGRFRVIAVDLPGFGDSDKPVGAAYDARFFARAVIDLLDALELERVHLIGNSLGGRVALEVGLRHRDRVDRLALLAPSLAWRRDRPWAPLLRLVRPELGLFQLAPRPVVEAIVRRLIPAPMKAGPPPASMSSCAPTSRRLAGPRSTRLPARSIWKSPTVKTDSGRGCQDFRARPSSSGAVVTGSCRSPSPDTSPTPSPKLAISSSIADTCRRSSVRDRPTTRSASS